MERNGSPPAAASGSLAPAPMELDEGTVNTGGDAPSSWAELSEAAEAKAKAHKPEADWEGFTKVRYCSHKQQRSDTSQQGQIVLPFPMDTDRRAEAVMILTKEATEKTYATCPWILEIVKKRYPDLTREAVDGSGQYYTARDLRTASDHRDLGCLRHRPNSPRRDIGAPARAGCLHRQRSPWIGQ